MDTSAQSQNIRVVIADTPENILSIQHQIWMKNTIEKRFEMTLSFIDSCRELNIEGIKNSHPDWSEPEIRREYFRILYRNTFSEEELKNIIKVLVK